jgi:arsenical pump membrane protein
VLCVDAVVCLLALSETRKKARSPSTNLLTVAPGFAPIGRHLSNHSMLSNEPFIAWSVIALAILGVLTRPFRLPEAIWAVAGAAALVVLGVLPWPDAVNGMRKGIDVYLFLIGMMLIAELARREGLFDWLAALAVARAQGSPQRLFLLIYLVGIAVTVLLSNDATAIVLTPAVYAATRAAGATPLPYLLVCAFIANAASFVLPISNPANLVVFGERMPHLAEWLRQFAAPSLASIVVTYAALRLTQRRALNEEKIESAVIKPKLSHGGKLSAYGIGAIGIVLIGASALNVQLGLPTFLCGAITSVAILALNRESPLSLLGGISWSVLPLVAGLFVMVEALIRNGVISRLAETIGGRAAQSETTATWGVGIVTALADNIANNLPVGLIAGSVVVNDHLPASVIGAMLIGVDLGPNLSVTGSLATILWLVALRREGIEVNALRFLGLGLLVMPPALIASLLVLW